MSNKRGNLDPTKMTDWNKVQRIVAWIVILNLMAFCTVMLIVDIAMWTEPTAATPIDPPQDSTVFDRAQKYD